MTIGQWMQPYLVGHVFSLCLASQLCSVVHCVLVDQLPLKIARGLKLRFGEITVEGKVLLQGLDTKFQITVWMTTLGWAYEANSFKSWKSRTQPSPKNWVPSELPPTVMIVLQRGILIKKLFGSRYHTTWVYIIPASHVNTAISFPTLSRISAYSFL